MWAYFGHEAYSTRVHDDHSPLNDAVLPCRLLRGEGQLCVGEAQPKMASFLLAAAIVKCDGAFLCSRVSSATKWAGASRNQSTAGLPDAPSCGSHRSACAIVGSAIGCSAIRHSAIRHGAIRSIPVRSSAICHKKWFRKRWHHRKCFR